MITEAIILAGGLGTRLRSVVSDVPKCMAPIQDVPFLSYLIEYALAQGVQKIVLAVGYKKEIIHEYFSNKRLSFQLEYCEEETPLGTGGAIAKALPLCSTENILILNGDTFVNYQLNDLKICNDIDCFIFAKAMHNYDRFGTIVTNENGTIQHFEEKKFTTKGLINTGVYILNKNKFSQYSFEEKFSFEKDYFEKHISHLKLQAIQHDGYFIDIGIPEDYELAQQEIPNYFNEN
jgi:D-glycero-alpha-D-manno-heptose 1-phosphate guanylyltransferase